MADRPILVLDEATAFADPESEAAIQDALSRLAAGRTLVVIAHRLSTITAADRILVLSGGEVVERGRHAELSRSAARTRGCGPPTSARPPPRGGTRRPEPGVARDRPEPGAGGARP